MWRISEYNRPLAFLYEFRDPSLEAQYKAQCNMWCRLPLRVYCCVMVGLSVEGMESQFHADPRTAFWIHLTVCLLCMLCLCATCWSSWVRRHSLPLLAFWCCAMGLVSSYLIHVNGVAWTKYGILSTLPDPLKDAAAQERVLTFIKESKGVLSMMQSLMYCVSHWMILVVAGLNRWTLSAFTVIYTALILTIFVTPQLADRHRIDGLFTASICTAGMLAVCVVLETLRRSTFLAETLLSRELQASQMADSVLNHCLKNTLAEVAANVELYLVGESGAAILEDCVTCLRRGIKLCKERQVYLKLVNGQYEPVLNRVDLREFGQQLIAGRSVTGHFCDAVVYVDAMLCNLILENALSNAFKHGPAHPDVRFTIADISHLPGPVLAAGHRRLRLSVTNAVNPERPTLTPDVATRLLKGERVVGTDAGVPLLSDRIGLKHCMLAANVAGITLSLQQSDWLVTFSAVLDAKEVSEAAWQEPSSLQLGRFPTGLRFVCLDDSPGSLRLLDIHLRTRCQPQAVRCFGASEADIAPFLAAALSADVAILDQQLAYSRVYYGTDLVQQLLDLGFTGLVCIRSGDDSPDDRRRYTRSGAHCSFGKDLQVPRMVEELKAAYVAFLEQRHPDLALSTVTSHTAVSDPTLPGALVDEDD